MFSAVANTVSRSSACGTSSRYISASRRICGCLGPSRFNARLRRDFSAVTEIKHASSLTKSEWNKSVISRRWDRIANQWTRLATRSMSSSNEEILEENKNCGIGLKNDASVNDEERDNREIAATDAQVEKARKQEEDFWLKMCSNPDPNDNTILPDAFRNKGPLEAQDGFKSPPDDPSSEHDKQNQF
eukprot:gene528-10211_t